MEELTNLYQKLKNDLENQQNAKNKKKKLIDLSQKYFNENEIAQSYHGSLDANH